jgi:DNA polymerase-3 subunit beta
VSRLINGNYPDYKQILPYKYLVELSVDKEEVLSALKIASLVAVDNNGEVVLKKKEGDRVLKVLSQSSESGENESQVKTSSKKGEFEIIFNCRFLIDGLNAVKSQTNEVLLKINQKKSPVLIRGFDKKGSEDNKISYIIMPIIKD